MCSKLILLESLKMSQIIYLSSSILNNKNAIEIDGKVVLSFDPRYKEYLEWRDKNPKLEKELIKKLDREIEGKKLYNAGMAHKKDGLWEWYNKDGMKVLECEMDGDKKNGKETSYYEDGKIKSIFEYKNGVFYGKSKITR